MSKPPIPPTREQVEAVRNRYISHGNPPLFSDQQLLLRRIDHLEAGLRLYRQMEVAELASPDSRRIARQALDEWERTEREAGK